MGMSFLQRTHRGLNTIHEEPEAMEEADALCLGHRLDLFLRHPGTTGGSRGQAGGQDQK